VLFDVWEISHTDLESKNFHGNKDSFWLTGLLSDTPGQAGSPHPKKESLGTGPALDNWRPCSLCSGADPVAGVRGFVPQKIFEILVCWHNDWADFSDKVMDGDYKNGDLCLSEWLQKKNQLEQRTTW